MPQQYDRLPFQLDLVISEKHEGRTESSNLVWSCFDCKVYKGPNIAGVDPTSGKITALYHLRQQAWTDHFEWQSGRLVGKTSTWRTTISVLRINLDRRVAVRQELFELGAFSG